MMFAYIDGDDIGLKIEKAFMENDTISLQEINIGVNTIIKNITAYLVDNNSQIIFSGADGIICSFEKMDYQLLRLKIDSISKNLKFSIGIGKDLKDAFLALRYAKANGKHISVIYQNSAFRII